MAEVALPRHNVIFSLGFHRQNDKNGIVLLGLPCCLSIRPSVIYLSIPGHIKALCRQRDKVKFGKQSCLRIIRTEFLSKLQLILGKFRLKYL